MVTSLSRFDRDYLLMTDKIVVICTCPTQDEAESLARALVEDRVAACVNVVAGLRSFYRWQGATESSSEWLLLIKTTREKFPALRSAIERRHSYKVPEVLALPVVDGAANYLNWIDESLSQ